MVGHPTSPPRTARNQLFYWLAQIVVDNLKERQAARRPAIWSGSSDVPMLTATQAAWGKISQRVMARTEDFATSNRLMYHSKGRLLRLSNGRVALPAFVL
jgi:hypothetical protein